MHNSSIWPAELKSVWIKIRTIETEPLLVSQQQMNGHWDAFFLRFKVFLKRKIGSYYSQALIMKANFFRIWQHSEIWHTLVCPVGNYKIASNHNNLAQADRFQWKLRCSKALFQILGQNLWVSDTMGKKL